MLGNLNFFYYSPESINFFSNAPVILMVSLTIRKDNHTEIFKNIRPGFEYIFSSPETPFYTKITPSLRYGNIEKSNLFIDKISCEDNSVLVISPPYLPLSFNIHSQCNSILSEVVPKKFVSPSNLYFAFKTGLTFYRD